MDQPLWDGRERRLEEEERRKICFLHQKTMDDMMQSIKESKDTLHDLEANQIPKFHTFIGQAKVAAVIIMGVYLGSYGYTYIHVVNSEIRYESIDAEINRNKESIDTVVGDYRIFTLEVKNLVKEVEKSNKLTQRFLEVFIGPKTKETE